MKLKQAIVDLKVNEISKLVQKELDAGKPPMEILSELGKGMKEVGKKFEAEEFFLSELFMGGETMKEALKVLSPHLKVSKAQIQGKVVLGTVNAKDRDFSIKQIRIGDRFDYA